MELQFVCISHRFLVSVKVRQGMAWCRRGRTMCSISFSFRSGRSAIRAADGAADIQSGSLLHTVG